ncbi:hypothetical protein AB3S75_019948 [Citrus x aurantiifolia]
MESILSFCFFSSFLLFSSIELSLSENTLSPEIFTHDGKTSNLPSQSYELGFFSPGNSNRMYLGICCEKTETLQDRVVWVATRDNPFIDPLIRLLDTSDLPQLCLTSFSLDCKSGDIFLQLAGIRYYESTKYAKECEADCLNNCPCRAYGNPKESKGDRSCWMFFVDLNEVKKYDEDDERQESHLIEKKRRITIVIISSISGIFILGPVSCVIWSKTQRRVDHLAGQENRMDDFEVPLFDLSTVMTATNNFSEQNLIGAGGFGPVYKGKLSTGEKIAVKTLSKNSKQGNEEFRNEAILIAKLQHKNLVGLLGICVQGEERLLIYEYMKNKSLDFFIFDRKKAPLLAWEKRFEIIMGIARGLLYLHQDSRVQIIHRDLKASNILLDDNLNPKISDFRSARIFVADDEEVKTNRITGTCGYISPEYEIDGIFSVKSDVFSFGVLLLEIVSGKKNRGFSHPAHNHSLLGHAWLLWKESRALELLDPCLEDSCVESQVLRCVHVGLLCVQRSATDRPAASFAVLMLANIGATLPQPKQPGFFVERSSADMVAKSKMTEPHTVNSVTITELHGR